MRHKIGIGVVAIILLGLIAAGVTAVLLSGSQEPEEDINEIGNTSKVIQICNDSGGCIDSCPEGLVLVKQTCRPDSGSISDTGSLQINNETFDINSAKPAPAQNTTEYLHDKVVTNATQELTDKPATKVHTTIPKQEPTPRPKQKPTSRPKQKQKHTTEKPTSPVELPTSSTNDDSKFSPITVPDGSAIDCTSKYNRSSITERQLYLYSISSTTGTATWCKPNLDHATGLDIIQTSCEERVRCHRRGDHDSKFIVAVTERKKGPPLWCKLCKIGNTVNEVSGFSCEKSTVSDCGGRFMRSWVKNSGCYQCVSRLSASCESVCKRHSIRDLSSSYTSPIPDG